MNNGIVLLKTLFLSTSRWNIYRHCTDKKKRLRIVGNTAGFAILYGMLMSYCIAICWGFGQYGMIDTVPMLCVLTISLLSFVFTLFKTNSYLFNFREYDMLMSLPLEARTVADCKFLYMF